MMDDKALTALKGSIEKWERNAVAETPGDYDVESAVSALCSLFRRETCQECPVMDVTGEKHCAGTPCWTAEDALDEWIDHPSSPTLRDHARAAARDEVTFLRSLLPGEYQ